jgi:threonine dehydrogenase-like Zn-dependent dehydrogenase
MRAVWLEEERISVREDAPEPAGSGGEAVVRVTRAGICATDLELARGYYPYTGIPGHEFVGVVERGPDELVGKRVVGEINAVCGGCAACQAGRGNHCERRTVLGIVNRPGAFAERLSLPPENLHRVPDHVPDDVAVFTEPLAAALRVMEQLTPRSEERVLVLGDGRLGQLVARVMTLAGHDVEAAGRHERKLALLRAAGIRTCGPDSVEAGAFDVVVECTGSAGGFATARRALRPQGTLVLKSTYAGQLTLDASALVVDEIRVQGSRCGPFAPAIALLSEGKVDPRPLIDARFPLREGPAAFAQAGAGAPGVLKVLLDID